ncbi:MAG: iron-containing alcohol dehydrogenase family protein [Brevinematia bacterium]
MMKYFSLTKTNLIFDLKGIEDNVGVFDKFSKIVVLTGKNHLKLSDEYERIFKFFSSLGKEFLFVSEVTPNPTTDLVERCFELLKDFMPDVIVAIGGGSVIDTAKALSVKLVYPGVDLWDYAEGVKVADKAIPVISVPTTSGTGSEVNRISVITNPKKVQKRSIKMDVLYPYFSLLIPSMTLSLNKFLTATTAIDALSHAIEAMVSKKSNFMTQAFAEKSIRLIVDNIFRAYNDGSNLEVRKNLQYASVLSGVAIDISGVGLMHALEHPISARFPHVSHGQGLAVVFKKVIEHSFMFAVDKFRIVAEAMGIRTKGNNDFAILHTMLDAFEYMLSYFGLNKRLSDLGVEKSDVKYLADDVVSYMTSSLNNSPYTPTRDSVEKIYREVL